jgi:hypothetical protein
MLDRYQSKPGGEVAAAQAVIGGANASTAMAVIGPIPGIV